MPHLPDRTAPRATYRLQLTPSFGFADAARVAPYLAALGVSHAYSSPYLQAAPQSTHGYDVVDHQRVNSELGGPEAHEAMCTALHEAGLGQVLDIVPNHMAIGTPENRWWWDVLENGPASVYASYFDVDWDPPEAKLRNTVLMPILGDHYGRVLEAGELRLARRGGEFVVSYYDHEVPVAPRTLDSLLAAAGERCGSDELESIAAAVGRLPPSWATDRESVRERHRDKEVLKARLAELCDSRPEVAAAVDAVVEETNADADALDALLERQNYRLAFWRTAGRELDYRRFFDITTLIGLRVEDPVVFDDTHRLVLGWVRTGVIDGLRIDHPDGLRDPQGYLDRLRDESGGAWVVVEKILEVGERLRASWPVAGTTGYDFLNRVGGLFVDPAGEQPLTQLFCELVGDEADYESVALACKRAVMRDVLAADLVRLADIFVQVCERHRRYRDYTRHELHEVLVEAIAAFPVYRTYVRAELGEVAPEDEACVREAVGTARERRPDLDPDLFSFLEDLLLLRVRATDLPPGLPDAAPQGSPENELVMRFQQATGPIMAKGVEDTAFYVYNRLVSLNEVGGDPGRFGTTVEEFHRACTEAQEQWPLAMLTTSTHDTKRSEDVRARISLLSEIPDRWEQAVRRWIGMNERHRRDGLPDRNAEYLLYQVLVGAWPLPKERATAYMEKAAKEAKAHTSWIDPVPAYDEALRAFVEGVLDDAAFVADLEAFVAPLVVPGWVSALAQTLLKLTAPGVPDVYQGSELWDLSLVDPDNRRPVDFGLRRRLLDELPALAPDEVWKRASEGLPKLYTVWRALDLRRRRPELYGPEGAYLPLEVSGPKAGHVVAFVRGGQAATVVPRLVLGAGESWEGTTSTLPGGTWRNLLGGEHHEGGPVPVGALFAGFPVALLEREA